MNHDQAVEELMETFGVSQAEAEEMAGLEEVGFVFDEDGVILPDVDPDEPINLEVNEQGSAPWN